jgi:hypothetical protein
MGSLFDTFLSEDDDNGQFQELQKALAAELERPGLSSDDVRHHVRYMW